MGTLYSLCRLRHGELMLVSVRHIFLLTWQVIFTEGVDSRALRIQISYKGIQVHFGHSRDARPNLEPPLVAEMGDERAAILAF